VKLDSSGNLLWNSFLGGAGSDQGEFIAVDGNANVLLGGFSSATWGSPVRGFSSGNDAIAVKLDPSGNLLWNSFLGGAGSDYGSSITLDGSANLLLAGSGDATWGSPVRGFSSGVDAMAVKLDPSGNLRWNTFLGGMGVDQGESIAVDGSANVLLGGYSNATWGSPLRPYSNGNDAMAVKLDSSGNLLWHTFLGGAGNDYGYAIAVDGSANILLGGNTSATWGSPLRVFSSGEDAMAVKLDGNGNLLWHTFLGGSGGDLGESIAVDGNANVLLGGFSGTTWGSPVRGYSGNWDATAVKLDSSGNLLWNTFLGGVGSDYGQSIALDSANVYLAGYSAENWGSPLIACVAPQDAFAIKIALDDPTTTPTSTPSPSNSAALSASSTLQIRVLDPLVRTGTLMIECRLPEARYLKLGLYSLSGKRALAASSTQSSGISIWEQNVTSLGQGSYLLLIECQGFMHKQRIVVIK
jgi:hypothetical protein